MSNQDEVLKQNAVFIEQFKAALEVATAAPGGLTPEVVALFDTALEVHIEWMASHDILFPDQVLGR